MATKPAPKKKAPMSKGQAQKVAAFLKKGSGGPAVPTPASNPVTTADDDEDQSQGA
jgi:hypothetical protein